MLRSIIFAIGLFLLILGGQSLIVDKLILSNRASIPRAIAGNRGNPYGQAQLPYGNGNGNFGNGNFGRGNVGAGGVPYNTAGYRAGQGQYYSQASAVRNATGGAINRPKRVYQTRDWMPWSLLAAGAVVVMYSASMRRG